MNALNLNGQLEIAGRAIKVLVDLILKYLFILTRKAVESCSCVKYFLDSKKQASFVRNKHSCSFCLVMVHYFVY